MNISVKLVSIDVNYKLNTWTLRVSPILNLPKVGLTLYEIADRHRPEEFGVINKIEHIAGSSDLLLYLDIQFTGKNFSFLKIDSQLGAILHIGEASKKLVALNIEEKRAAFLEILNYPFSQKIKSFVKENLKTGVSGSLQQTQNTLSKIGGLPIAQANFTFPKAENGKSMMFIGQLNVQELLENTSLENPFSVNEGIFYLFASTVVNWERYENFEKIYLFYSTEITNLTTATLPTDLEEYGHFDEHYMLFFDNLSLPAMESGITLAQKFSTAERNDYEFIQNILTLFNHRDCLALIQHPEPIQNCIVLEAAEALERQTGASFQLDPKGSSSFFYNDWLQLMSFYPESYFQKLSSLKKNIVFNDIEANLYLLIKKEDLKKRDYAKLQLVGQCD